MKRNIGKTSALAKLKAGLEDAIAYHRGAKQLTVRDVELKPPPPMGAKEVLAVRAQLRVSQAAFARILNGLGVLNFASVQSDVLYLIPRDDDWSLTSDDLSENKFEYLRPVF